MKPVSPKALWLLPLALLAVVVPLREKVERLEVQVAGLKADLRKAQTLRARLLALGALPEGKRLAAFHQAVEEQGLVKKLLDVRGKKARFEGLTWGELVHLLAALERKGIRVRGVEVDAAGAEVDL